MRKECTDATKAFNQAWAPSTTHIITFGCQLDKQQKKCKNINVIILDEAKTLPFVGKMYKSDYYTEEQMTKYEIQADINKTWLHTMQFFTKLFAQCKAYRDDRAANSKFGSVAHINGIPTNRNLVSTSSNFTTCNLYIKSLESMLQEDAPLPQTSRTQQTYYAWSLMPNSNSLTSSSNKIQLS
jgi:hypothetical protein